jgi:hypothetical protein
MMRLFSPVRGSVAMSARSLLAALLVTLIPATAAGEPMRPAAVPYRAERILSSDGESETFRVFYSPGKERLESVAPGGGAQVTIVRYDRGIVWFLLADEKAYIELSIEEAEMTTTPLGDGVDLTAVGSEKVNRMATTKYRVAGEVEGFAWLTREHIPVRLRVSASDGGVSYHWRMEQRDIRTGPQDPGLFELPPGWQRKELGEEPTGSPELELRRELLRGLD